MNFDDNKHSKCIYLNVNKLSKHSKMYFVTARYIRLFSAYIRSRDRLYGRPN